LKASDHLVRDFAANLHAEASIFLKRSCFEVPKFLSDDLPLFFAIVNDLFPGIEVP
jgi:hypothetical protein